MKLECAKVVLLGSGNFLALVDVTYFVVSLAHIRVLFVVDSKRLMTG